VGPFSNKTSREPINTALIAENCVAIVQAMMGVISEQSDDKVNVVRDHFLEVLALSAFGCRCGLQKTVQQMDGVQEIERTFHEKLLGDLIQAGVVPETERHRIAQFIRTRLQEYHAVLAEHGTALSQIELDGAMEGIGTIFEQACRGPHANHTANAQDASLVLYLRHVAREIFRLSLQLTGKEL